MSQLTYWKVLTRRKTIDSESEPDTKLSRVMGTFDLTALGVGATLGVGVYVLAGHVAKDQAGPSVVLSFAIAAVASLFAGLCYAEFGARVPKAGSAYIYSYVCIGEFAAFVIGWNLILEYIIGSASVARGLSLYLDTLINNTMQTTFREVAPIDWGFVGTYFDFFAFFSAFILGVALAFGLQKSTIINNCFTVLNIVVVLIVIIAGAMKADIKNWQIPPAKPGQNSTAGDGGFFPYGFEGTIKGAATCFFGFVGFDCIATTGEEVKNPRKAIPRSILFSLLIIFLAYLGISTVLTLMWPYYLQNPSAPLPYVFEQIGWPTVQWIVTIGGMIGLISSMFGAMFPLPRIMYAMSQDGLIFHFLGDISTRFKTPIAGTICAAALTGLMAAVFDLRQLVNMLSIGTLLAYTVVAISITILRHMNNNDTKQNVSSELTEGTNLVNSQNQRITASSFLIQIFNCKRVRIPNVLSTRVVGVLLFLYCFFCFAFSFTFLYATQEIQELQPWALALSSTFLGLILILLLAISVQPKEHINSTFTVPLVPLIPGISVFVNIYLMLQLDIYTWIRFGIWMALGIPMYLICICIYRKTQTHNSNLSITYSAEPFDDLPPLTDIEKSMPNGTLSSNCETLSLKADELNRVYIASKGSSVESVSKTRTPSPKGSLDEIIPASELTGTIREIKTPNGNTLFVEDTSQTSQDDELENDDAKSVIAILDNVLKVEDASNRDLYRFTSLDSDYFSSPIETAAIVHKSFDGFHEDHEDYVEAIRVIGQSNQAIPIVVKRRSEPIAATPIQEEQPPMPAEPKPDYPGALNGKEDEETHEDPSSDPVREAVISAAVNLISDILSDDVITQALQDKSIQPKTPPISLKSSRKSSASSEDISTTPSRSSQKFREKLRKIIINSPFVKIKKIEDPSENLNKSEDIGELRQMKQSKSETDLANMSYADEKPNLVDLPPKRAIDTGKNNIPKAPKFDPVLYKTMGNRYTGQTRDRPKLHVLIDRQRAPPPALEISTAPIVNGHKELDALPFKVKLEALLKRGPSYRTKIRPDSYPQRNARPLSPESPAVSPIRETVSAIAIPVSQSNDDLHKLQLPGNLNSFKEETTTPELSPPVTIKQSNQRPATLEDARKRLKPIRQSVNHE